MVLSDDIANASLLSMLWSPPNAAGFPSAGEAHQSGVQRFTTVIGTSLDEKQIENVRVAVSRAAASDYLPGLGPDGFWVEGLANPNTTHPFAGEFNRAARPRLVPTDDEIDRALRACIQAAGGDWAPSELKALAVWRMLPEFLAYERKWPGGALRHEPVAHPAYPDSVWNVGAMRAATAVAGEEPAVLFFTVASVQDYIAQARRTQDLWIGSYIYAYLVWHAMKPVVERLGPWSILTPNLRGQPFVDIWLRSKGIKVDAPRHAELQVASLPNIFTTLIPYADAEKIANDSLERLQSARDQLSAAVKGYVEQAVASTPSMRAKTDWGDVWEEQVKRFAIHDCFWSVVPWTDPESDLSRLKSLLGEARANGLDASNWAQWRKEDIDLGREPAVGAGFLMVTRAAATAVNGRKVLRDFPAAPLVRDEAPSSLCTLCASRTAISLSGADASKFWSELATVERNNGGQVKLAGRIRRGERLCAPCAMKRLAMDAFFDTSPYATKNRSDDEKEMGIDRHQFPSTATVATESFRRLIRDRIGDETVKLAAQRWLEELKKLQAATSIPANVPSRSRITELPGIDQLDGSWLIPSSYDVASLQREFNIIFSDGETTAVGNARKSLNDLIRELRCTSRGETRFSPPSRYYAVVSFDGDHVGEWLQGKNNPSFYHLVGGEEANYTTRPPGPMSLMAIAEAGHTFSIEEAPRFVNDELYLGNLIYAGGDDTLALVSRTGALSLATKLASTFQQFRTSEGHLLLGGQASASAAIVIAHHSEPLTDVIYESHRQLKQRAKAEYGRSAFVVHVIKRSGPRLTAGLPWEVEVGKSKHHTAELLANVSSAMAGDILSRRLLTAMRRLRPALGQGAEIDQTAVKNRFLYHANRHVLIDAKDAKKSNVINDLSSLWDAAASALSRRAKDDLENAAVATESGRAKDNPLVRYPDKQDQSARPTTWDEMTDLLAVAEFIARESESGE